MTPLTRTDLKEEVTELKAYIGERVGRVEEQFDRLNGRIQKHDRELAEHGARMNALEELVNFEPDMPPQVQDDDQPALTKRDVKRLVAFVIGVGGVVAAVIKVLDFVGRWWS